jgi:hypothetical protein
VAKPPTRPIEVRQSPNKKARLVPSPGRDGRFARESGADPSVGFGDGVPRAMDSEPQCEPAKSSPRSLSQGVLGTVSQGVLGTVSECVLGTSPKAHPEHGEPFEGGQNRSRAAPIGSSGPYMENAYSLVGFAFAMASSIGFIASLATFA